MNDLARELSERSKLDDALIVGSEIRAALQEQREQIDRLTRERDEARAAVRIAKQLLEPALPFLNKRVGDE